MFNSFKNVYKKNICAKVLTAAILLVTIISGVALISYSENVSDGLADNIIRLHVLANSDSPEDQQLKRDVRDVVISFMKDRLKNVKDVETTKKIIEENSEAIKQIALDEIKRQNKEYDVEVMLGIYPFPTKVYGDISLPAGNYQALRVVIGNGEGQNWWCVLFPPLCFVDATHGTVPDSVKNDLKEVLSEEEYYLITTQDEDEDIPIEIKFKIVEMFQNSKIKIASAMNRMFQ
ncbi:stage II sporulation protein R [Acetivibrio mesophilus]|uniref:Stage II sporulation protein R n=1 Tax=Acetivibrio mesophilus TaxID=2487273 RepID=A0A4Q0I586_9FIRM|nr:stage II sporulation protein R [Acetivibrio mesophilus]ODM26653.1 stage II sporulation protein R [Clostridium sp. Bc-iso-3]RXE58915.1 stage II sporulation protein R [Acetivibrio mesophilus]HHV28466.1 stage II sporulation protein R [Clostridium sp.]